MTANLGSLWGHTTLIWTLSSPVWYLCSLIPHLPLSHIGPLPNTFLPFSFLDQQNLSFSFLMFIHEVTVWNSVVSFCPIVSQQEPRPALPFPSCFHTGILFALFDHEERDTFLQNIGWLSSYRMLCVLFVLPHSLNTEGFSGALEVRCAHLYSQPKGLLCKEKNEAVRWWDSGWVHGMNVPSK